MEKPRLVALVVCVLARVTVAGEPLHLMAFNVLFRGADDVASVKAVADEAPDVVCLSEVTPAFVSAFERSQAARFPHRAFAPKSGTWGLGVASKYPLRDVQTFAVAPSGIPAMEATIVREGTPIRLVCVHLNPPVGKHRASDTFLQTMEKNGAVRVKQAATLVARYAAVRTPVVLFGDFNETPGGPALAALEKAGWSRGCALPGSTCSATFPGPALAWPSVFEIDHVYARGLRFHSAATVRAGGSDHFPVSATVSLLPRE
jgi:endonuclease/exonuclease/phosphatase family metal-dependent hydrolase